MVTATAAAAAAAEAGLSPSSRALWPGLACTSRIQLRTEVEHVAERWS